jgi:hypothetical protein
MTPPSFERNALAAHYFFFGLAAFKRFGSRPGRQALRIFSPEPALMRSRFAVDVTVQAGFRCHD